MNVISRPQRIFWVLGILLLVGTVAGAGWFFNHNDKEGSAQAPYDADFIVCQGLADLPQGTTSLYPVQPGRVTALYVTESDVVAEGQLLFSTDDRFSRQKWQEAQADLEASRETLRKAQLGPRSRQFKIEQQKIKIEGAKAGLEAQRAKLTAQQKLYSERFGSAEEIISYQQLVKGEELKVAAELAILKEIQELDPTILDISRAKQDIKAKEARLEQARIGVLEHDVYAPADGTILRVLTREGELLGSQPKLPAMQFCPLGERIIRAEVHQEWAGKIAVGQTATVVDESRAGYEWKGTVTRISDWYTHRRSMLQEPFQFNDVRTLECIVSLTPGSRPLRIGQRVRVTIKQGGP